MDPIKILITENLVKKFGELSGDKNPIHFDESFAKRGPFKKRVAHGTIILAKISSILTKKIGDGNILIEERVKFLKPIYIGETVEIIIESLKRKGDGLIEVFIIVKNSKNNKVMECTAICKKVYIKNERKG
jgi:3-hydroxybutyryl-CoA dehydratase